MVWALHALMLASASVRADAVQREDEFKAAYVINFVKFVEWPDAEARERVTICLAGAEGVHRALTAGLEKKRVGATRLVAMQVADTPATGRCNVLYIDASMASDYALGA
jgi:hypothetical protein